MAEQVTLLTLSPRVLASGAAATVRLAGGGTAGFTQFGSTAWMAGLGGPPATVERLGFDGGGFGDGALTTALVMAFAGDQPRIDQLGTYYWRDAPFTLHSGPEGGNDAAMSLKLVGRVVDIDATRGAVNFSLADLSVDAAKPVVTSSFAGTGDIEGDPEIKGRAKRRALGALFNVGFESLLRAHNIHVISDPARPIAEFVQVYDRGNAASAINIVAWAGSVADTLAALIAAVPPAGGCAAAPSIACIKWWHANPGKLTCDMRGEIGAAYVDRPVDIALALLGAVMVPTVDAANINAHRAARDYVAGWLVSDLTTTAAAAVQSLMAGVSSWYHFGADGVVRFGVYAWTAPVAALVSAQSEIIRQHGPVSQVNLEWRPNKTVMARGDIAEAVFAADVTGLGALATQSSVDFAAQVSGAGKPESNADVTMVVTSPPPVAVPYNFDGSDKAGELPVNLNFKLLRGTGADVTTLASWSAVLKSGTAAFTIGAATGILEVTSCSADAVFEVSAAYLGTTRKGQSAVSRKLDNAPPSSGGSGGGTTDSTSSISSTTTASYGSPSTRDLMVTTGAGGIVTLAYPGQFGLPAPGSASAFGKWQWRVPGGTWADVSSEIAATSGASRTGGAEPENTKGSIMVSQTKSGLTASTLYEFRLLLRGSDAVTLNWTGTASGVGS